MSTNSNESSHSLDVHCHLCSQEIISFYKDQNSLLCSQQFIPLDPVMCQKNPAAHSDHFSITSTSILSFYLSQIFQVLSTSNFHCINLVFLISPDSSSSTHLALTDLFTLMIILALNSLVENY
jgi:hypothetical protein